MRSWTLACSILTLLAATACKAPKAPDPGKVAAAGAEASKASQAAEAQRLLVLRMQVGFIDREAPYGDVGAPAGFEWVVARAPDAALVKATRGKWDVARGKVQAAVAPGAPASTSLEAQQAFTWLTSRLEEMYEATGDTEAAQNVDTTALDILKDPGYRQELACHLARAAANHGDVAYAKTWLATTDADSKVPREWLREQVALANRGVDAVAGTIRVVDWDGYSADRARAFERFYAPRGRSDEHQHEHATNLGVRADAYESAGGFSHLETGEDHALWSALRRAGRKMVSTRRFPVVTSARLEGRAPSGFADFLNKFSASTV